MAFGELWGLVACHTYGHHGMRVSLPVRQMLRLLSQSISRNVERLIYAQRLHTRKLVSLAPRQCFLLVHLTKTPKAQTSNVAAHNYKDSGM